jgi:ankyrin repeat protein
MARSFQLCVAAVCIALSGAVFGQEPTPNGEPPIAPDTIEFIPPVARAVLAGNEQDVEKALATPNSVDQAVRAKDGARAGFTPLILAAALSEPKIAQTLIDHGAKVTILDDFHRSAFWYAAQRQDLVVTEVLSKAPGAREAVNAADSDLQRTPLQIAIRGSNRDLVTFLIGMGASKEQRDIAGESATDYCKRHSTEVCSKL